MPQKDFTIILEPRVDYETWIWHALFGIPYLSNDINVLHWSPLMNIISFGETTPVEFVVNVRTYNYGYSPDDGIYQKLKTFVELVHKPSGKK
jgi:hypothetical protein